MKTTLPLLALFALVLIGGYAFAHRSAPSPAAVATSTTTPTNPTATTSTPVEKPKPQPSTKPPAKPGTYTAAQVAAHSSASSCWTIINGNVYDLTNWIGQHPGGEAAILSLCGKDGTQAFEGKHGSSDDPRPKEMLATFKIGILAP